MRLPSWKMLLAGFLAIWVPYVASVGLQERFRSGGALGPGLMLVSLLIAGAVASWFGRILRSSPFGLRFDRWTLPIIAAGLAAMGVGRIGAGYLAVGAGIATYDGTTGPLSVGVPFAVVLAMGAVPALVEDILTRGFPLFAARSARPAWLLILVSAAMYTVNHVWRFDFGISEQVRLFCMGIAYAIAAWRVGSLWAAFGLHLGWNAGSALVPLDIGGTDAFRYETAAIHLIIAVLLLLIPARHPDR